METAHWMETDDSTTGPRYWFRTPMGMEALAAAEIRSKLPVAHLFQSHRNVFVVLRSAAEVNHAQAALEIRTADDVYRYLGSCREIDRTKASVDRLIAYLEAVVPAVLSAEKDAGYFRSTVSFVGKRNFNRYFVEEKINAVLAVKTKLQPLSNERKDEKVTGELRLRCHIEEDTAFIGLGLQDTPLHRRSWRSIRYPGQLHTPVAAGMVRALNPEPGSSIVDPFCGSGTILIEAAIQYPHCKLWGSDIQEAAIDVARQSADLAGVDLHLQVGDSLEADWAGDGYYLVSNPPWDEKHQIDGGWPLLLKGLIRLVSRSTGAVLLLPEELAGDLQKNVGRSYRLLAQTRVRGKLALIVKFDKE